MIWSVYGVTGKLWYLTNSDRWSLRFEYELGNEDESYEIRKVSRTEI